MQFIQMDPRFMHVFEALTGIDLNKMGAEMKKSEEVDEAAKQKAEEERKKAEQEEEERKKKEAEEALPDEEKKIIEDKRKAEAAKLEGNAFYKAKNFEKAIEKYSEAISLNPKEIIFYSNLAAVHMEQKDYDTAMAECDKGIEIAKEQIGYDYTKLAKVMARKAACLAHKGQLQESIDLYKSALLEDNQYAIKEAMRKVEKQRKDAEALEYINPEIGVEHKEKGNTLFREGNFPAAIKEFDEAIKRDPTNASYYSNRSFAYIKLMEPVRAKEDAEKALSIDPNFVKAYARKATCHSLMKEYHKAMECYEKGLKIDPESNEMKEGYRQTLMKIQTSGDDQERQAHAMADPEIQAIMKDPSVMQVLRDMQEQPQHAQSAMNDPVIRGKINKLIAAGVVKIA